MKGGGGGGFLPGVFFFFFCFFVGGGGGGGGGWGIVAGWSYSYLCMYSAISVMCASGHSCGFAKRE